MSITNPIRYKKKNKQYNQKFVQGTKHTHTHIHADTEKESKIGLYQPYVDMSMKYCSLTSYNNKIFIYRMSQAITHYNNQGIIFCLFLFNALGVIRHRSLAEKKRKTMSY